MGSAIVRQPNGLLARFSSGVDGFTHYDMTEQEYVKLCVQEAKRDARREAVRALETVREHGTTAIYKPFDIDFDKAMKLHLAHGWEPLDMAAPSED